MINDLSIGEKKLLLQYFPQMETATKQHFYKATPSTDMKMLHDIYKRHIDKNWVPRPFCGNCCMTVLTGLYELTNKLRWECK